MKMNDSGVWKNYETYMVVEKIFEMNDCFNQTVQALRLNPEYQITAEELQEIANEMYFERIGFENAVSAKIFLAKVDFSEIAEYLNTGARRELGYL